MPAARVDPHWRYHDLRAVVLERARLRLSVLPDLGAKVYDLVLKSADRNFPWHNPRLERRLLLMDEPLSNLDAKLRVEMRTEIRRLQRELGITTVYVAHDQEEALAISERLAVMNAGRVEQVGFPWDVYQTPQSAFVARSIGTSNALAGRLVAADGDRPRVDLGGWALRARRRDGHTGKVLAVFRPEALSLAAEESGDSEVAFGEAVVVSREFLGAVLRYRLRLDDGRLIHLDEHKPGAARLRKEGLRVRFMLRPDDMVLFPLEESS